MRYKIIEDSCSGHGCCFGYTIVDTLKEGHAEGFDNICECFIEEDATKICDALNSMEPTQDDV